MCCSWRRTSFVNKPCDVNRIEQVRQVGGGSRRPRIAFFLPRAKGIGGHSRFMKWKPTWLGFTASPLGDVLASNWVLGSVARDDLASRLRFPFQILCVVTGKDDAEVFVLRVSAQGAARPTFRAGSWNNFALSCVPYCRKRVPRSRSS